MKFFLFLLVLSVLVGAFYSFSPDFSDDYYLSRVPTANQQDDIGSADTSSIDSSEDSASADAYDENESLSDSVLGNYSVLIDSVRIAKGNEDEPILIVKYCFANVYASEPDSFSWVIDDIVFQNGVGLNEVLVFPYGFKNVNNYDSDTQRMVIKKGVSIEVEKAYYLNDVVTDVEVTVKERFGYNGRTISKTFPIAG